MRWSAPCAQDLMRRAGIGGHTGNGPGVTIQNLDRPPHDLSQRRQAPAELTTVLGVLQLPEDARTAGILRNFSWTARTPSAKSWCR